MSTNTPGHDPSWFTVTDLGDGVFLLAEDLSFCPEYETGTVNSYLILGDQRAALLDTGMGIGDIAAETRRLTSLDILVVNSHSHWDHVGGNPGFRDIRIHPAEAAELEKPVLLPEVGRALARLRQARPSGDPGATEPPRAASVDLASARPHRVGPSRPTSLLVDGETLDLGHRVLRVIETPGHSPGSLTLCDEGNGLLFTADTVYEGTVWLLGDEAAGEAPVNASLILTSIGKLRRLIDGRPQREWRLFPGHERTPLQPGFLPRLERALTLAAEAMGDARAGEPWSLPGAGAEPVARKLTVNGLDFLLPYHEGPR